MRNEVVIVCIAVLFMGALTASVSAQSVPLQAATKNAIVDEWGGLLDGTHPDAADYGVSAVEGDLVHVLQADSGIFPPDTNGVSHFANPVLYTAHIGEGVAPNVAKSGLYSDSISPRPSGQVFMRIYNAPRLEDASFYVDSQVHVVGSSSDPVFMANASQTDQPLDPHDDDNDGLNNSWEKSYGTDKADPDSDDDGVNDGDEHATGTDPKDATSKFVVARIRHGSEAMTLEWDSVPGFKYVVEFNADTNLDEDSYQSASGPITASASVTQFVVTNGMENAGVCYRVKKVD